MSLVGPLVAEKLGVPYYRWKLPISGAGVAQLTEAERDGLYVNNPRLWGHFIPGAPCVLSENQGKIEWRISNGTVGKFYSLTYQGKDTRFGEAGARAGQVIDIETPDAVNVEFPELEGVKALDYASFTKVAGKVVLAIPAAPLVDGIKVFVEGKGYVKVLCRAIPVASAIARTIHKSQGATLAHKVLAYLEVPPRGKRISFAHFFVLISRVTCMKDLRFFQLSDDTIDHIANLRPPDWLIIYMKSVSNTSGVFDPKAGLKTMAALDKLSTSKKAIKKRVSTFRRKKADAAAKYDAAAALKAAAAGALDDAACAAMLCMSPYHGATPPSAGGNEDERNKRARSEAHSGRQDSARPRLNNDAGGGGSPVRNLAASFLGAASGQPPMVVLQGGRPTKKRPAVDQQQSGVQPQLQRPRLQGQGRSAADAAAMVHRMLSDVPEGPERQKVLAAMDPSVLGGGFGEVLNANAPSLRRVNFHCLRDGEWLNDEVCNTYLDSLQFESDSAVQAATGGARKRNVWFADTFLLQEFMRKDGRGYAATKRATLFPGSRLRTNILEMDTLVIMRNLTNTHWTCFVVDIKTRTVTHYDSVGDTAPSEMEHVVRWLCEEARTNCQAVGMNATYWTTVEKGRQAPQQHDGFVYFCLFTYLLCIHPSPMTSLTTTSRAPPAPRAVVIPLYLYSNSCGAMALTVGALAGMRLPITFTGAHSSALRMRIGLACLNYPGPKN